jgi:hypothetical protein
MCNTFSSKLCGSSKGRKILYIKIKDKNASIKSTRQTRAQGHTTQRKKKQTINKNKVKTYVDRTYGNKMMININKEDLR